MTNTDLFLLVYMIILVVVSVPIMAAAMISMYRQKHGLPRLKYLPRFFEKEEIKEKNEEKVRKLVSEKIIQTKSVSETDLEPLNDCDSEKCKKSLVTIYSYSKTETGYGYNNGFLFV